MSRAKLSAALLTTILAVVACGGKDKKPPATPDTDTSAAGDSGADMPASPGSDTASADGGSSTAAVTPDKPESKPPITLAAMKFTAAKGKKPKAIDVKGDGSVTADGKPAGKVAGDHVEDAAGKTLVSVSNDGAISGDTVKPGLKFSGDDVVDDGGAKVVTVGDDGTVQVLAGKKLDTWGKADGGGSAKRAAAIVAVAWLMPPAAPAAPAKPAGGGKKPAPKK